MLQHMFTRGLAARSSLAQLLATAMLMSLAAQPGLADGLAGRVLGGGAPIAGSAVTLWAASAEAPQQLATATSDAEGAFRLDENPAAAAGQVRYLTATGGAPAGAAYNAAINLMAVLGADPAPEVVVNEFSTIASVWTGAQFLDGYALRGPTLGLKIAAGNVPSFIDPRPAAGAERSRIR